uniref:Transposase-like protein TnpA4 n=1 Tax=Pseudomonas putida TaxID=303 RepID=Q9K4S6_PSEPU|nr:transposase-like protein TnpA4 [Pseudomonas putida]
MSKTHAMQKTFSVLEIHRKKKQPRRDRYLADLEQLVPDHSWRHKWRRFLWPRHRQARRSAIGLPRIYIVQQCFGIFGGGAEDTVYDSQAIRSFIGIDLGRESAPDFTILLRFRRLLETHLLTWVLFETINQHLASRDLPAHIGVDATSGLVHSFVGMAANAADVSHVNKLLHGAEPSLGSSGYTGAAERPEHLERDVIWSIAARPSSYTHHGKGNALYQVKRKIEYPKAQLRAKVEHPFQVIKCASIIAKSVTADWKRTRRGCLVCSDWPI